MRMAAFFSRQSTSILFLISALFIGSPATLAADSAATGPLPKQQIEKILLAQGDMQNGVLHISIQRKDLGTVSGPSGTSFSGAFVVQGDLFFQSLTKGQAFLNADFPLKQNEVNPFIKVLLAGGLVFQAFHQHLPMDPQVWFVHFRGTGTPEQLATAAKTALGATSTKFPQSKPKNITTPLDTARLAGILHGHASVDEQGVVDVWVYRSDPITIEGVTVNPQANISTNIQFMPRGGTKASAVPDFAMTSAEINPVVKLMLDTLGWYQGCLYNQETAESPQLYFDHMVKTGDAYDLAKEIRRGLDLTKSQ